jgi:hypothetical protein
MELYVCTNDWEMHRGNLEACPPILQKWTWLRGNVGKPEFGNVPRCRDRKKRRYKDR